MKQSLIKMAVIVCAAVVAGAVYKQVVKTEFPWIPSKETLEAEDKTSIAIDEVKQHREEIVRQAGIGRDAFATLVRKGALVIDAREEALFVKGHLAADYIINIGYEDERLMNMDFVLRLDSLLQADIPIIIYCEGVTCDSSMIVYETLAPMMVPMPHRPMFVFEEGWDAIGAEDSLFETTDGFVDDPELVIDACLNGVVSDYGMYDEPTDMTEGNE